VKNSWGRRKPAESKRKPVGRRKPAENERKVAGKKKCSRD
jgi:hypothetical protein